MDDSGKVIMGIRQIVRLKGFLQKWQKVTLGNRPPQSAGQEINGGIMMRGGCDCDSDEENGTIADVPQGYLAVYVGQDELRRFVIPTGYLSDPVFKVLLDKVEEEFGFKHCGGLTIPCEIETFKFLLKCMETQRKGKGDHN